MCSGDMTTQTDAASEVCTICIIYIKLSFFFIIIIMDYNMA